MSSPSESKSSLPEPPIHSDVLSLTSLPVMGANFGAKSSAPTNKKAIQPVIDNTNDEIRVRLYPDSPEMKFWTTCVPCKYIMQPNQNNCCCRLWGRLWVVPLTNVTGFSLYYQLYLDLIFHRVFGSRFGHYTCMPMVVWFTMYWLAQWTFGDQPNHIEVFTWSASAIFTIVLAFWWVLWGFISSNILLGFGIAPTLIFFYGTSNVALQLTRDPNGGHWYCPTENAAYNPFMWMIITSFLQAASHIFEPFLPPRVSGSAHWISMKAYWQKNGTLMFLWTSITQLIFGTLDEWLASPRLLPLFHLKLWYFVGYRQQEYEFVVRLSEIAILSGDPALDYIGIGGNGGIPTLNCTIQAQTGEWVKADQMPRRMRELLSVVRQNALELFTPASADSDEMKSMRYLCYRDLVNTSMHRHQDQQKWTSEGKLLKFDKDGYPYFASVNGSTTYSYGANVSLFNRNIDTLAVKEFLEFPPLPPEGDPFQVDASVPLSAYAVPDNAIPLNQAPGKSVVISNESEQHEV